MILKKKLKQQIKPQNISDIADLFNVDYKVTNDIAFEKIVELGVAQIGYNKYIFDVLILKTIGI